MFVSAVCNTLYLRECSRFWRGGGCHRIVTVTPIPPLDRKKRDTNVQQLSISGNTTATSIPAELFTVNGNTHTHTHTHTHTRVCHQERTAVVNKTDRNNNLVLRFSLSYTKLWNRSEFSAGVGSFTPLTPSNVSDVAIQSRPFLNSSVRPMMYRVSSPSTMVAPNAVLPKILAE